MLSILNLHFVCIHRCAYLIQDAGFHKLRLRETYCAWCFTLSVTLFSSFIAALLCSVSTISSPLAASRSLFIWPFNSWKCANIISLSSFKILFLSSHSFAFAAILLFNFAISSYDNRKVEELKCRVWTLKCCATSYPLFTFIWINSSCLGWGPGGDL